MIVYIQLTSERGENMKFIKKIISVLLCLSFTILLGGCQSDFDVEGYVEGILDNTYKGISTSYVKTVDITLSEAQQEHESAMNSATTLFLQAFSLSNVSTTTYNKFYQFFDEVYKNASYEIKKVETSGNGYEVELTVNSIDVIHNSINEISKEMGNASIYTTPDFIADKILNILNKYKKNLGYTNSVTVKISVIKDSDGLYTISSNDLQNIDQYIIDYE